MRNKHTGPHRRPDAPTPLDAIFFRRRLVLYDFFSIRCFGPVSLQIICNHKHTDQFVLLSVHLQSFLVISRHPLISFFVRYFNTLLTMLAQSDSSFSLEILKVVPFEHLIVHPMRRQVMYGTMYVTQMISQAGLFYQTSSFCYIPGSSFTICRPQQEKCPPRLYECPLVKVLHC